MDGGSRIEGSPYDLTDKIAIVTGSTSGIGRATAFRLAGLGARVVVNSRHEDAARSTAEAIVELGGTAIGIAADVSRPEEASRLVAQTVEHFGTLDILVNNAGLPQVIASEDLEAHEWQRLIDTNLTGPFLCATAAGRVLLAKGDGVIVNVSSVYGQVGVPGRAAYCSAKHGVEGLTKVLASEWAGRGVLVCSVAPGYVSTALVETNRANGAFNLDEVAARTPLGRLANPEEVAEGIAFVVSPAASYLVGPCMTIDGGWLAHGAWSPVEGVVPAHRGGEHR